MVHRLALFLRQQSLGALALFVALGGSAYAAATVNSASVVDDSLTTDDIKGRDAPFTQGTITGADVLGSPAVAGRPFVDGGLTGADIADGSIKGADVFSGTTLPNSAKLGGLAPDAYGRATASASGQTSFCDSTSIFNQCAPVAITVPPGRRYRAVVYSSFAAASTSSNNVRYCPAVKSPILALTCLTGVPPPGGDRISLAANYAESGSATGDTSALGFDLGSGTWTFSTLIYPGGELIDSSSYQATTTVVVTDATPPGPDGVAGTSGSSGTCTSSSGTSQSSSSGTSQSSSSSGANPC